MANTIEQEQKEQTTKQTEEPVDGGELPEVVVTPTKKEDETTKLDTSTNSSENNSGRGDQPPIVNDTEETETSVTSDYSLIPDLNYTDPIVRHDGGAPHYTIPVIIEPSNSLNEKLPEVSNQEYDQERYLGVFTPVVKLNNLVIYESEIIKCEITYEGFLSTIYLEIDDKSKRIQKVDSPGMNGSIDIAITPSIPDIYRTINMQFEITSFNVSNTTLYYSGRHKIINMEQRKDWGMIKYPGCGPPLCNVPPNPKPNTWEYLHEIAKRCGLGFQTTDQCREIEDRLPRLLRSQSYTDFIEEQIKFGGLDENSIFDVWVDVYGYLTMVNLPWIFNNDISFRHLSITTVVGPRTQIDRLMKPKAMTTHRTLWNMNAKQEVDNLEIANYIWETSNYTQQFFGNLERRTIFTPRGVRDGKNDIKTIEVQQKEPSADGEHTEDYEKYTVSFYCDFNEYDTKLQENIRKNYLDRLRAKKLILELTRANLGLQRGTLINVAIMEGDNILKTKLMTGTNQMGETDDTTPHLPDIQPNPKDYMVQDGNPYPNPAISGLYYIDGMKFEWDNWHKDIRQTLILIKKGRLTNPTNKYSVPAIHTTWLPEDSDAPEWPQVAEENIQDTK